MNDLDVIFTPRKCRSEGIGFCPTKPDQGGPEQRTDIHRRDATTKKITNKKNEVVTKCVYILNENHKGVRMCGLKLFSVVR